MILTLLKKTGSLPFTVLVRVVFLQMVHLGDHQAVETPGRHEDVFQLIPDGLSLVFFGVLNQVLPPEVVLL
jgi:hypothetical protein